MLTNHTSPPISPKPAGSPGYYVFIPLVLLTLMGCVLALVCYIRRRSRIDELRHRLIPLYTYDPEEEDDWLGAYCDLTEPLRKEERRLSLSSAYGT